MRTPLVIKFPPEIKENSQTDLLVQNLDIAPTLLHMAGISVPAEMQGNSLRSIWQETDSKWRDALYYHYYEKGFGATPHYGIRTDRYKLIHFYDLIDSWEFYDLENDPSEMNNLMDNPEYLEVIDNLKIRLHKLQAQYKETIHTDHNDPNKLTSD